MCDQLCRAQHLHLEAVNCGSIDQAGQHWRESLHGLDHFPILLLAAKFQHRPKQRAHRKNSVELVLGETRDFLGKLRDIGLCIIDRSLTTLSKITQPVCVDLLITLLLLLFLGWPCRCQALSLRFCLSLLFRLLLQFSGLLSCGTSFLLLTPLLLLLSLALGLSGLLLLSFLLLPAFARWDISATSAASSPLIILSRTVICPPGLLPPSVIIHPPPVILFHLLPHARRHILPSSK
mmetsp:Transcript_3143/g.7521  ORF Transcript_3143/g.7521 Transcript_3143/m.7521 type:complete len:235 (-) Transcript_3143:976-1680(-)